jgi:hypothetical protein
MLHDTVCGYTAGLSVPYVLHAVCFCIALLQQRWARAACLTVRHMYQHNLCCSSCMSSLWRLCWVPLSLSR